jgi:hypothetical protein
MENYDLSTVTLDNLHSLLSSARDKIIIYNRCREELNALKKPPMEIELTKNRNGCLVIMIIWILVFLYICKSFFIDKSLNLNYFLLSIGIFIGGFILNYFDARKDKQVREKAQIRMNNKIREYEEKRSELPKEVENAFNNFFAVIEPYKFPRDYWYEYAITTMLTFVEKKLGDSWKEIAVLYENHLHQMRMEDSARQTIDEIKRQSEEIKRGANAAQWAAAGAWIAALRR